MPRNTFAAVSANAAIGLGKVMKINTWPYRALGTMVAAISLIELVSVGLHVGWTKPFQAALNYYDALLHFFTGWAEPILRNAIALLDEQLGWHIKLYPQWKHSFVVLTLLFSGWWKVWWDIMDSKIYGIRAALLGILIALSTGVLCGTIPLDANVSGSPQSLLYNAEFFGIFTVGYFSGIFVSRIRKSFLYSVISLSVALVLGTPIVKLLAVPNPGVVLAALTALTYAVVLLAAGVASANHAWFVARAIRADHSPTEYDTRGGWWGVIDDHIAAQAALNILATFGCALLFVLANAGAKLAGLP